MKKNVHQQDLMDNKGEWRIGRVVITVILLLLIIAASIYVLVIKPDKEQDQSLTKPLLATKKSRVTEVINPVTQRKEIIYEDEVKEILSPEEVYSYNKPRNMAEVIGEKIVKSPPSSHSTNNTQIKQDKPSLATSKNQTSPIAASLEKIEDTLPLSHDQKEVITKKINRLPSTEAGMSQTIEIEKPIDKNVPVISELKTPILEADTVLADNNLTSDNTISVLPLENPVSTPQKQDISTVLDTKEPTASNALPIFAQTPPAKTVRSMPTETTPTTKIQQQNDTLLPVINKEKPIGSNQEIAPTTKTPSISNQIPALKTRVSVTDSHLVSNKAENILPLNNVPSNTQEKVTIVLPAIPSTNTIPELPQQTDTLPAVINEVKPVSNGRVVKALITTGLVDREPIDKVTKPITINDTEEIHLYFFTKIMRMIGETLYHQWLWNDQLVYEKPIEVKARRWRATTSKLIPYSKPGQWTARILNSDRDILKAVKFTIIQK